MLTDTHAHLNDSAFDQDRDDIITHLKENRVDRVFVASYNKQSILDSIALAEKYSNVYAMIGIHPEETQDYTEDTIALIRKYATHPKVIAIGEIGLDYHFDGYDRVKQKEILIDQLKIADEYNLPICIHNRDSIGDLIDILQDNKHLLKSGGVLHCFSESVEIYKIIKSLGLKIGFGGTLTFKNSVVAPKVCEAADIHDIVIETDCPYLAPQDVRGKRNEPKYTTYVAEKIALIKKMSYDQVVDITTQNALDVYRKVKPENE